MSSGRAAAKCAMQFETRFEQKSNLFHMTTLAKPFCFEDEWVHFETLIARAIPLLLVSFTHLKLDIRELSKDLFGRGLLTHYNKLMLADFKVAEISRKLNRSM